MSSTVFKIETGVLALTLVDPAAVGYLTSWQAPAGKEVDAVLLTDYATAPASIPSPVFDAAVNLTVELYRRKDAPFGVTDSWGLDGASIRLSSDVMKGTASMLAPYKARWGIG